MKRDVSGSSSRILSTGLFVACQRGHQRLVLALKSIRFATQCCNGFFLPRYLQQSVITLFLQPGTPVSQLLNFSLHSLLLQYRCFFLRLKSGGEGADPVSLNRDLTGPVM